MTSGGTASITTSSTYVVPSNTISGTIPTFDWAASKNTWGPSSINVALNSTYLDSLGSTWSNKIENVMWRIGGNSYSKIYNVSPYSTVYTNEITSTVTTNTTDNLYQYAGKIGLMYVSDLLYAAPNDYWSTRASNNSYKGKNWLVRGVNEWTITRRSDNTYNVYYIDNDGALQAGGTCGGGKNAVRPVFYLKSSVTITKTGFVENEAKVVNAQTSAGGRILITLKKVSMEPIQINFTLKLIFTNFKK